MCTCASIIFTRYSFTSKQLHDMRVIIFISDLRRRVALCNTRPMECIRDEHRTKLAKDGMHKGGSPICLAG